MSILASFFVATPQDARLYATPAGRGVSALRTRLSPVEYGGLTSLELEILWSLLAASEWDPDVHALVDETPPGSEGTWLFRIPDAFVELLASATPDALHTATTEWAATEELNCDAADLVPVASELQAIARLAVGGKLHMYLWGST